MSEVKYLLLFKGDSDKGGPEASVRSFTKLESARTAMAESYSRMVATMNIPVSSGMIGNPYTVRTESSIRLERYGDVFRWEIIKAVPEDSEPSSTTGHSRQCDQPGAILRVTGDRNIPLMDALLELCRTQPETLEGLVEVIPEGGETLRFQEVCQFRPSYLKALNDISQLLQDNGYEAASKFLDCSFEL